MNIKLREVTDKDFDFAFEAKRQAMGPHIITKWGWDESYQLALQHERWSEKPWFIILMNDKPIGTASIQNFESHVRFGEFYLYSQFQNQGIGTKVLQEFLTQCDQDSQKVVLEYLKWSPVGSLYKRNGFKVTGENDIHYFMAREPNAH